MLDTMAATKVTEDVVDTQIIEDAVRLACRAPSLNNSQPWLAAISGITIYGITDEEGTQQ
jgi:hypothetical protein